MNQSGVYQLFVYGSLRSGFHSAAYEYISRYFTFLGIAKVKGCLYDLGKYPAGVPDGNDTYLIGELYRINNVNEFNWAIAQLDDYEGVQPSDDEPPLYRREITTVYCDNGLQTHAWIYWYNGKVEGYPVIPSGDLLEYIRQKG